MGAKEKQISSLDFVRTQKQQTKHGVPFPRKQFEQQSIMGRELKGNTCPVMLLLKRNFSLPLIQVLLPKKPVQVWKSEYITTKKVYIYNILVLPTKQMRQTSINRIQTQR